jgi:hypothetical protein
MPPSTVKAVIVEAPNGKPVVYPPSSPESFLFPNLDLPPYPHPFRAIATCWMAGIWSAQWRGPKGPAGRHGAGGVARIGSVRGIRGLGIAVCVRGCTTWRGTAVAQRRWRTRRLVVTGRISLGGTEEEGGGRGRPLVLVRRRAGRTVLARNGGGRHGGGGGTAAAVRHEEMSGVAASQDVVTTRRRHWSRSSDSKARSGAVSQARRQARMVSVGPSGSVGSAAPGPGGVVWQSGAG